MHPRAGVEKVVLVLSKTAEAHSGLRLAEMGGQVGKAQAASLSTAKCGEVLYVYRCRRKAVSEAEFGFGEKCLVTFRNLDGEKGL